MKLRLITKNIVDAVNKATGTLPKKTTIDALFNFLLKAENGQLTITANNLQTAVIVSCEAEIKEDGKCLVDGRRFSSFVKMFSDGDLELDLQTSATELTIKYGKSKTKFAIQNADIYPELPKVEKWENTISVPQSAVKKAIVNTVFVLGDSEVNNAQTGGVNFNATADALEVISLSGATIAIRNIELTNGSDFHFNIPLDSAVELKKVLSEKDGNGDVKIEASSTEGYVQMTIDNVIFLIRLSSKEFPKNLVDSLQKLPETYTDMLTIVADRKDLVEILNRCTLISTDITTQAVVLSVKEDTDLRIQRRSDIGDIDEYLEIEKTVKGTESVLRKGFNVKFLLNVFNNISDDTVTFISAFSDKSPAIIKGDDYFYAISPCFIPNELKDD